MSPRSNPFPPLPNIDVLRDSLNESQIQVLKILQEYWNPERAKITSIGRYQKILLRGGLDLTESEFRELFKNIFRHHKDISTTLAITRLVAQRNSEFSKEECIKAVRWVVRDLTTKNDGQRTLPKNQDFIDYRANGTIIPETGTAVPTLSTLLHKLFDKEPGHSLAEIVYLCLPNIPLREILTQLQIKVTKHMLVSDYKNALTWFERHNIQPKRPGILTYDDLDLYAEKGSGQGSQRYRHFIEKSKAEIKITLNDIREAAQSPRDTSKDLYVTRSVLTNWEKEDVKKAYIEFWEGFGFNQDPPSVAEINHYSKKHSEIINRLGKIDPVAFAEANLPTFLIPSITSIEKYFGSLGGLLAGIESDPNDDITVVIESEKTI